MGTKVSFLVAICRSRHMEAIPLTLDDIIAERAVSVVYQPIFWLQSGSVFANEALTRGPAGPYASPQTLFESAAGAGRLFALEMLCREEALRSKPPGLLCLNVDPRTLEDSAFRRGMTAQALEAQGILPSEIVFEVTERFSISDFSLFRRTLDHYRSQGYRIALDDVGAGHSNLRLVAEAQPEIVKIDKGLVQGVAASRPRRAAISALLTMASELGALAVAEGIETVDDLGVLQELGAPLGQGFLMGAPAAHPIAVPGVPIARDRSPSPVHR